MLLEEFFSLGVFWWFLLCHVIKNVWPKKKKKKRNQLHTTFQEKSGRIPCNRENEHEAGKYYWYDDMVMKTYVSAPNKKKERQLETPGETKNLTKNTII